MCEISEKIYKEGMEDGRVEGKKEGIAEGRLESQKETAESLFHMGMAVEDMAKALKVHANQVQEWLLERANQTK